ncbi:D-cysteine desulfhydrase family protein [Bradyrhizobium sp. 40]|uniref:D-cysteine desulfhydrase family protein n=1 Tax=Bradyrhizobium sp. 40 TaxID=2782674 RepID=UPI001FFE82A7|nr:D-cysteine desulfhydrase family protein [Bradyrhizobium sp. 40]UPJ44121.1 D-cysteine desulfhydrase family protein [Bradyrhizobium sp. 40]
MNTGNPLMSVVHRHKRSMLGHLPTPLESLDRMASWLGGPRILIKRDDATGLGMGGNKIRALEYLLPDALEQGCDLLLTAGVIQSNSVRQVAAAAAKLGLDCHFAMITDRVPGVDSTYRQTGNILLNYLYGATHEPMKMREDRVHRLGEIAARFRANGRRPYVIPYGCANRLGAVGYLNAALEISEQARAAGRQLTHIVHASGTGGTQAGLIAGFAALDLDIEVIGIDVDADTTGVRSRVEIILRELARELDLNYEHLLLKVIVDGRFSAGAYGMVDDATLEAITAAAKFEALVVDPVYSGKALAGVIGLVREGRFASTDEVVFLHTGGTPAIYAYRRLFPEFATL